MIKCFSVNNVALFPELLGAHVMCAKSLQSCVAFCDPMDSSPLGFSRQEYWSGLPFPSPGDLPDPGIKPMSLTLPASADVFFTTSPAHVT